MPPAGQNTVFHYPPEFSLKQISFAQAEHQNNKKVTRRERFLGQMLRIYFLQQRYALVDEALEDAIYDSHAMRDFICIDLVIKSVPDATDLSYSV